MQSPRIPIWAAGVWPNKPPIRRAARWDGYFPIKLGDDGTPGQVTVDDARAMLAHLAAHRTNPNPHDLVVNGRMGGDNHARDAETVAPFAAAGVT
ncbi:MAG: hypothetical protein AVDCRST_MAG18-5134 [uncultured Thermomicrobiales bacterium]|uniref:Uncharacterized protein n=1 Tax=uncultured Thermomicrobiales bacterium TaxID=1645740 RepID=A0A6J4VWY1_9BACT|nr:MAG: hypothetical protein AVDCRST_MAG18-5134 [uncultured Thermomicrobiales bacterium]